MGTRRRNSRLMKIVHIITRLIVGGAQENTIATVLGLREKPRVRVELIAGPTTGPEGTLEPVVRAIPDLFTLVPELVRPGADKGDFSCCLAFRFCACEKIFRVFRRSRERRFGKMLTRRLVAILARGAEPCADRNSSKPS